MSIVEHKNLTISPRQAVSFVQSAIRVNRVPYLVGSPAIGKSSIAHQIAETNNLKLIDIRLAQCDPTDLNGFPRMDGDKASYLPMDTFPLAGEPLPVKADGTKYTGWFLFFDELPAASKAVQAAAYKILLDRKVGQYKLHDNVRMMAAGNKASDNAVAGELSTALRSRMINAELEPSLPDWINWATDPTKGNIHHFITSFLQFKPGSLYNFDPDSPTMTYASPRTWEFMSDFLHDGCDVGTADGFALCMGTIGITAHEFAAFVKTYGSLPTLQAIESNPTGVDVPTAPGTNYALTGALATWMTPQNGSALFKYISRMQSEYQVVTLRDALMRNVNVRSLPEVKQWVAKNHQLMVG